MFERFGTIWNHRNQFHTTARTVHACTSVRPKRRDVAQTVKNVMVVPGWAVLEGRVVDDTQRLYPS